MGYTEMTIEGRNAVMEAFRSGKTIDKLYVLDGCQDGPVLSIMRRCRKYWIMQKRREKNLFFFCWITLRIRIIWEQSSERRILPVRTG